MPSKAMEDWENRRKHIQSRIDALLKEKGSYSYTLIDAKREVAENDRFCDYRSIDRMLKPYKVSGKQTSIFKTIQFQFNY